MHQRYFLFCFGNFCSSLAAVKQIDPVFALLFLSLLLIESLQDWSVMKNTWSKSFQVIVFKRFLFFPLVTFTHLNAKNLQSPGNLKVGPSRLRNFFAKLKFSQALFEKIPSFVCLVFKIENEWILKLQNLFS